MYNSLTNSGRGQPLRRAWDWQWLVLLMAVFAWLLPQTAAADFSYEDNPDNYAVELGGLNVIFFTAPCYDMMGADTWI